MLIFTGAGFVGERRDGVRPALRCLQRFFCLFSNLQRNISMCCKGLFQVPLSENGKVFASILQVHSLLGPHVIVLGQTSLKNWLQIH